MTDGRVNNTFTPEARIKRNYIHEDVPDRPLEVARTNEGSPVFEEGMVNEAMALAIMGCSDVDLAKWFKITVEELNNWKREHIDFERAVERSREVLHNEALHTIRRYATDGYSAVEELYDVDENGEAHMVKKKIKHHPPKFEAAKTLAEAMNRDVFGKRIIHDGAGATALTGDALIEGIDAIVERTADLIEKKKRKKAVLIDG